MEYVPLMTPMVRIQEKPRITSPPKTSIASEDEEHRSAGEDRARERLVHGQIEVLGQATSAS